MSLLLITKVANHISVKVVKHKSYAWFKYREIDIKFKESKKGKGSFFDGLTLLYTRSIGPLRVFFEDASQKRENERVLFRIDGNGIETYDLDSELVSILNRLREPLREHFVDTDFVFFGDENSVACPTCRWDEYARKLLKGGGIFYLGLGDTAKVIEKTEFRFSSSGIKFPQVKLFVRNDENTISFVVNYLTALVVFAAAFYYVIAAGQFVTVTHRSKIKPTNIIRTRGVLSWV